MEELFPPPHSYVLSGDESQLLRTYCTSHTFAQYDLDAYAILLQRGPLTDIRKDFSQRAQTHSTSDGSDGGSDGAEQARKTLASIAYGPTQVPLFNYLLQLTLLNPDSRKLYLEITRYLALDAKVPCDSVDLSGTSAFMYAISTKPYWDPEFAEILLQAGAKINRRNRYGCTAAHDIVMARNYTPEGKKKTIDALKWFLQKGGDLNTKDGDGVTPRAIACKVWTVVPELANFWHTIARPGSKKIGRNDPCPCGGGKKFKACCGKNL